MGRLNTFVNWIDILQTIAIVGSSIAAFVLIKATNKLIHTTDSSSKKRATVEALLTLRLDKDYIELRNKFRGLLESDGNLAKYAGVEHKNSDNTMIIYRILNFHEYLATGVCEDAFDEEIYKRMCCTQVLEDWRRLSGFVAALKEDESQETLYQEFKSLAKSWKANKLKTKP